MDEEEAIRVMAIAVEDVLIEYRDSRISMLNAPNGLVVREADGEESSTIRLRTIDAMRIAYRALQAAKK